MITILLHDPTGQDIKLEFDKQGDEVFYTLSLTEHQSWKFIDQALPQLQELRNQRTQLEPEPEEYHV